MRTILLSMILFAGGALLLAMELETRDGSAEHAAPEPREAVPTAAVDAERTPRPGGAPDAPDAPRRANPPPPAPPTPGSGAGPVASTPTSARRAPAWHARAVSALDGAPVAGAEVHEGAPAGALLDRAGADGRLRLDPRLAVSGAELWLTAPGHGPALFVAHAGQGAAADARALELRPAASLDALAPAGGASGPLVLRVRAARAALAVPDEPGPFHDELVWERPLPPDQRALLEGLPAGAPLQVELWSGEELLRRPASPLVLEPGERRVLDWSALAATELAGRAVDGEGLAVVGVELWLLAEVPTRQRVLPVHLGESAAAVRRATTASDGGFVFEDVPDGAWWIGAAPGGELPPLAFPVEVDAAARAAGLELELPRGAPLGGRVVDAAGEPVAGALVWAQTPQVAGPLSAWSDADGAFELGPAGPGVHALVARTHASGASSMSEEVEARAGDSDVVLALRGGDALEGRVVDPRTGAAVSARVSIDGKDGGASFRSIPAENGDFRFEGLPPGRYTLCAHTPEGRVALARDVELGAGASPAPLRLELAPGARLRVERPGGGEPLQLQVRTGGALVQFGMLGPRDTAVLVVPPGELELRATAASAPARTRTVRVEPGEEARVVL